jgi:hypothetical protein
MHIGPKYMVYYLFFILFIFTPMLLKNFEIINKLKKNFNYNVIHKFTEKDYYSISNITNSIINNYDNNKCISLFWNNNYLRKRYKDKRFIYIKDLIHQDKSTNVLYSYLKYKYPNGTTNDIWKFCNGIYKNKY